MKSGVILLVLLGLTGPALGADDAWVAAMKAVHAAGGSEKGSVSQIGDSITYTKAFLAGLAWGELKGAEWKTLTDRVNGKLFNERKGPEHCNYSGWTAADGLGKIKGVLAAEKPEIAVVMYGTNDVGKNVSLVEYEKNMTALLNACLAAGCIPLVSTIPPIMNKDAKVAEFNAVIKKIAAAKQIPLVDFNAEILARQPGTAWNGTLLGKDDVHPSGGKNFDFSDANLKVCGYALRNYLVCKSMKTIVESCLKP